tara:strand:+ start:1833 stop:1994 length:162 start_codon:yes stop_codon:yes gene_type:complete
VFYAQVAELVDALALGASILLDVEVQVLSWAHFNKKTTFLFVQKEYAIVNFQS